MNPLSEPWPGQEGKISMARKQKFLVGIILFCLGVLVDVARDYGRTPLGAYSHVTALVLMLMGVVLMAWWLSAKD